MSKIKYEDIVKDLAKENWTLISESYTNLDTVLTYICSEGHTVYGPWKKFREKKICPICAANALKDQENIVIPKKKDERRILSLDQATKTTGYAIYSNGKLIKYGTFTATSEDEIERDHEIKEWLISMVNSWEPDVVGLEGIQYQKDVGMAITVFEMLARLQGILMETLFSLKIPYIVCHVGTWRQHCQVKGKTRTDRKRSMQLLVKKWFDITVTDDCADAIGIGKYVAEVIAPAPKMESWE